MNAFLPEIKSTPLPKNVWTRVDAGFARLAACRPPLWRIMRHLGHSSTFSPPR
jgi:hypothetical protein